MKGLGLLLRDPHLARAPDTDFVHKCEIQRKLWTMRRGSEGVKTVDGNICTENESFF